MSFAPDRISPSSRTRLVMGLVFCAIFVHVFDVSSAGLLLPSIAKQVVLGPFAIDIMVTAYYAGMLILLPASEWITRRLNTRPAFICACILYAGGALWSSQCTDAIGLMYGRLLQGGAGGVLIPLGRALVLSGTASVDMLKVVSTLSLPGVIAPMVAPPIAGLIIDHMSWRWVFIFLGLSSGVIMVVSCLCLPRHASSEVKEKIRFDLVGYLLLTGCAFATLIGVIGYSRAILPHTVSYAFLLGAGGLGWGFSRHALQNSNPVLDISLFRIKAFAIAITGGSLVRVASGATPILLSLTMQMGLGMSATMAGFYAILPACGALLVKLAIVRSAHQPAFRIMIIGWGTAAAVLTIIVFPLFVASNAILLSLALITLGLARSMTLTIINALTFYDLPDERLGQSTAISTGAQQIALLTGGVLCTVIVPLQDGLSMLTHDMGRGFILIGLFSFVSLLPFLMLPREMDTQRPDQTR